MALDAAAAGDRGLEMIPERFGRVAKPRPAVATPQTSRPMVIPFSAWSRPIGAAELNAAAAGVPARYR